MPSLLPLLLALLTACEPAVPVADPTPAAAPAAPAATPVERPNVLFVLADDMGYGDPRCYQAGSRVPTPALDRLAHEGLRLTDMHTPSAVCSPTRYGLLTGRYAWRTELESGVLWGRSPLLIDPERETLADLFARAGYHTAVIGKWHLGLGATDPADYDAPLDPSPLDLGFDRSLVLPASLDIPPYLWIEGDRAEAPLADTVEASGQARHGGGGFWRAGERSAGFDHAEVLTRIVDEGADFVREAEAADPERPWFLYLPLTAPHTPWLPSEPFRGLTDAGVYGDFAAMVDAEVGRLLATLDELGLAEETLVVFTSDNGAHWTRGDRSEFDHRANGPWRGQKADVHEGGHRVPFLVRWPGHVPAGEVRHELGVLTDCYATFARLLGHAVPAGAAEDSVDQAAVWLGLELEEPPRTAAVHHSMNGLFALRQGRYKLIDGQGSGGFSKIPVAEDDPPGQLYDLRLDPGETTNLWHKKPDVVERLSRRLARIRGDD